MASEQVVKLKAELSVLQTARLPRILERIQIVKNKLADAERVANKAANYENSLAGISSEQEDIFERFIRLYGNISPKNRDENIFKVAKQVIESLHLEVSEREAKILSLFSEGLSEKEVAEQLNLSSARIHQIKYKPLRMVWELYKKSNLHYEYDLEE